MLAYVCCVRVCVCLLHLFVCLFFVHGAIEYEYFLRKCIGTVDLILPILLHRF